MIRTSHIHQQSMKIGKKRNLVKDIMNCKQLYIMFIPFLIWLFMFDFLPYNGLQLAFKDYNPFVGINESPWVGLEHFKTFFSSPYAYRIIRNTLLINFYSLLFKMPATIILALLFNEIRGKFFRTAAQTISYMPHFISTVVVVGIATVMLSPTSGIINILVEKLGGEKTYFLADPKYFRTIYVSLTCWQQVGFGTIIFTSAIYGIDETLYEAAAIDGAGRFRKVWHITIPGIMPTIATVLIINIGHILELGADTILLLYQPITYETADVISTYVYRIGLQETNYSLATAVNLLNGVIAFVLVMLSNRASKKLGDVGIW